MNRVNRSVTWACGALLAGVLTLAGCGGGGSGGSMMPSQQQGTLKMSLTDAPACGFDHVYVTVDRVRVHTSASAPDTSGGWSEIVLNPGPQKIDLLTLTNGALYTLGQTALPAGNYQQIRLVLESNDKVANANSVVPTGGVEQALITPSGQESGLKVNGNFTVAPGTLTDVVLDFDACKSIVRQGNGRYSLKPVISAIPVTVAGALTGTAVGAPGAMVYAQSGGEVVKATIADLNGDFNLSPIAASTLNMVDIVIVPTAANARATGVIRDVPVVAEKAFSVGNVNLPFSTHRTVSGNVTATAQATLSARQVIGGRTYEIASTSAASDGSYAFYAATPALPVTAPLFGTYQTLMPIPMSFDTGAAGKYLIRATSSTGAINTQDADVRFSDVTNLSFSF